MRIAVSLAINIPVQIAALPALEVTNLGDVAVTLKIMPEDVETDLNQLRKEIQSRLETQSIEEEPIAFGLKALKVLAIVPDAAGGTDEIEEKISNVPGVKDVQVTDIRRLL